MIETHPNPDQALSDSKQQITPDQLKAIIDSVVVTKENSLDQLFKNKLELLRNQIDSIDHQLLDLLAKRLKLIAEIGHYKKKTTLLFFS